MSLASILAPCRRVIDFAAGFVREHAPESSVRLCMLLFAVTACGVSVTTVLFAFHNPTAHLMVGELVGLVGALLGTGVCGMALRTKSSDSAEAKINMAQLTALAEKKIEAVTGCADGAA